MSNITLPQFVHPKGLLLAYAIPLLLASLVLAFAGTFLTLDRTRYFVPLDDHQPIPGDYETDSNLPPLPAPILQRRAVIFSQMPFPGILDHNKEKGPRVEAPTLEKPRKLLPSKRPKARLPWLSYKLQGGVGGLLAGFCCGLHLVTLLALYAGYKGAPHLPPGGFLALWILTSIITTLVAGRFKAAALLIEAISGSFCFCTILSQTLNPPLQARIVLLCVFTVVMIVPPLLYMIPMLSFNRPVGTLLHWSLRLSTTSLGTLGLLVSIALLSRVSDWESALSILWVPVMPESSGKELGLTIFGWILLPAGVVTDWVIYRLIGGSNDQEWDRYLASYMDNLPDRAGHFEERPTLWSRVTGGSPRSRAPFPAPATARLEKPAFFNRHAPDKYAPTKPGRGVNFDALKRAPNEDDTDDDEPETPSQSSQPPKPSVPQPYKFNRLDPVSNSSTTTLRPDEEPSKVKAPGGWDIDDFEKELSSARSALEGGKWKPGFLSAYDGKKQ